MSPTTDQNIVARYYQTLGFRVKNDARIDTRISEKFFIVASNPDGKIGVVFLNQTEGKHYSGNYERMLEMSRLLNAIQSTRLKMCILATSERTVSTFFKHAKKAGIGILFLENEEVIERLAPEYNRIEAKTIKEQLFDSIQSVNIITQGRWGFWLIDSNEEQIKGITLPCSGEMDMTAFLLEIATIIDSIDTNKLKKKTGRMPNNSTVVDYLKRFMVLEGFRIPNRAFETLRALKRLRNNREPVHRGRKYKSLCRKLTGKPNPTNEELSQSCINRLYCALLEIRNAIR